MDDRDGKIYTTAEAQELVKRDPAAARHLRQVIVTAEQLRRRPPRVGRNDPCPCGSGKKFKKCCLGKGGVIIH